MKRFLVVALSLVPAVHAQLAIRGETVHTVTGQAIRDGVVLVRSGKIERVGTASQVSIPDGYRTLTAKVVTPGLIDSHTVVGLSGLLNQAHDQDQLDRAAAIQPELRAMDAYDPREKLVEFVRNMGITTIHTGHAPGALISGQTMVVKTRGTNVEQASVVPEAMVAATLGTGSRAEQGKSPGTRAKAIAMLRGELIKAREYAGKKEKTRDLRMEVLVRVLQGDLPLLVTVHRAHDILTAIRMGKEFDLKLVLDGVAEAHQVLEEIKASGYSVIVHPTMYRAGGETENLSFENAMLLRKAGIPFALQSGFEAYVPKTRIVLFEAALAASHGLGFENALASVTIDAARLLGIDKRVGSLETGKDADLALFDGDPFEYVSHCIGVVIDGEVVSEARQ
ncbi:MAG: amidohydrolase family protein [Bryobacteraceae bacterium]